jgi:ArsR family transcriptional regulator
MPNSSDDEIPRLKAELFRTLGHPARVRILEVLREDERSVGELQALLGADSSGVSQHLAVLRRQGLVDSQRAGKTVRYHVKEPRALQLMEIARQILSAQMQAAQALLDGLAAPTP